MKLLVYTDLNDTLLDAKYDFSAASEALGLLKSKGIPLIINTSKTRGQIEIYRRALGLKYPIIAENGGAVYFPAGSFPKDKIPKGSIFENGEYLWELGKSVQYALPNLMFAARSTGAEIETILEMPVEQVMRITNMTEEEALACKDRRYCIYFLVHKGREELFSELKKRGYSPTSGSYFCHLGYGTKGEALKKLTDLYRREYSADIKTAALGDNYNDASMMEAADYPILVERPGGGYADMPDIPGLLKIPGIGPIGWNEGVKGVLKAEVL